MRTANRAAALLLASLVAAVSSPASAASVPFVTDEAASVAVGQPNLTSNNSAAAANGLNHPQGVWSDGTKLIVADSGNNRVLIYNTIPTTNDAAADVVIGQNDMTSKSANQGGGPAAYSLKAPAGIASDGTKLIVADQNNQRVLIYNTIPTSNDASADVVIGQNDFTSNSNNQGGTPQAYTLDFPSSVNVSAGKLYISDLGNSRVLIYNSIPTADDAAADVVVGQDDMVSHSANQGSSPAAYTLADPQGLSVSGSTLAVADSANNRVLIYTPIPTSNNASASLVLGQKDFAGSNSGTSSTTFYSPASVFTNGTSIVVSDYDNSRLLAWSTPPVGNGAAADVVIGQVYFTSSAFNQGQGSPSATTLSYPSGMTLAGGNVIVADYFNNRVLLYPTPLTVPDTPVGLSAMVLGTSSITWTWNAAAGATGYDFYPSSGGPPLPLATNSFTQTGLTAGTQYGFSVAGVNAISTSAVSTIFSTYTFASPPAAVAVAAASTGTVTVDWTSAGGSSGYELDASTATDFSGTLFSSVTANGAAALTVSGLNGETSYYLRVGTLSGGTTYYAASVSTLTPSLPPAGPSVSSVTVSTVAVSWTPVGSNGYELDASTAANFSGTIVSSVTTNGTASSLAASGLFVYTTYYLRAGALWNGTTNYASAVSTMTLGCSPGSFASTSSISCSLCSPGYFASASDQLQCVPCQPGSFAGFQGSSQCSQCQANYYQSMTGQSSCASCPAGSLSPPGSYACVASPVSPAIEAVFVSSVAVSWTPVAGAGYELDASTAPDFSGTLFSSVTANGAASTLTVSGLSLAATYYFRVGALLGGVTNYAATLISYPAPQSPALVSASSSSVVVQWTAVGSGGYELDASTAPDFSGTLFSSVTANGAATRLTAQGLSAYTTYYLRAGALWYGTTSYAATLSTQTPSAPPAASTVTAVSSTSITMGWSAVGSSGYVLLASTAANFSGHLYSSSTTNGAATSLTVSGLALLQPYYLKVGALWGATTNYAVPSSSAVTQGCLPGFVSTAGATACIACPAGQIQSLANQTSCQPCPPGFAVGLTGQAACTACGPGQFNPAPGQSTCSLCPTGQFNPSTSTVSSPIIQCQNCAAGSATDMTGQASCTQCAPGYFQANTGAATCNGCMANHFQNSSGGTVCPPCPAGSISPADSAECVEPPSTPTVAGVFLSSVTVTWTAVTSQGYELDVSTASNFSGTLFTTTTSTGSATTLTLTGLNSSTMYYLRVGALLGGVTNYAATQPLMTASPDPPPGGPAVGAVSTGTIAVSWTSVASLGYELDASTAVDFTGTLYSSVTPNGAAAGLQISGLSSYTTYYLRAGALWTGTTSYAMTLSTVTRSLPLGTLTLSGTTVSSATIQWSWALSGGPGSFTLLTSTGGLVAGPAVLGTTATSYQETNLSPATNYTRYVEAQNGTGQVFSSTASAATPLLQSFTSGGSSSTVTGSDGQKQLAIPGADLASNVQWLLSEDPIDHPLISNGPALISAAAASIPAGSGGSSDSLTEYIVSVNGSRFTGTLASPVTVTVPYADANDDGLVDGTNPPIRASTLRLYVLNEATSQWQQVPGSSVDTTAHVVTGQIGHLSIFNAFGVSAASDLSGVRVYPVPYKPDSGDPNQGVPYAAGNPNSGIVFDTLPAQVTIKIYTIAGRLVTTLTGNSSGTIQWDARNSSGKDVASGGYLAVISSPGLSTVIKKLLVIR